jgi:hypothetical protein
MYVLPSLLHFIAEQLLTEFCLGQSWTAAWAFELVGDVFLLWMMIMAYQVYREFASA